MMAHLLWGSTSSDLMRTSRCMDRTGLAIVRHVRDKLTRETSPHRRRVYGSVGASCTKLVFSRVFIIRVLIRNNEQIRSSTFTTEPQYMNTMRRENPKWNGSGYDIVTKLAISILRNRWCKNIGSSFNCF